MISVNENIRKLYRTDSIDKTYFAVFKDLGIMKDNSEIIAESLSITESVCSYSQFKLGLCEANAVQISMYLDTNVTGDEMTVFEVLGQFEPEITIDDTKGITLSDDFVSILYEGSLTDIGNESINFDSGEYYLLLGKFQYTGSETYIYTVDNNNTKRYISYYNDNTPGNYNICVPIIGSDFQNQKSKLYSNKTISGYFTLYRIDYPIMPLGIFYIDSAKKSHEDSSIRDLIGYDKLVLSKLDDIIKYTATDSLHVNSLMSNALRDTPLRFSIDLPEEQTSGSGIGYTIISQSNSNVSVPNPVYTTTPSDTKSVRGTYIEFDGPNDPVYLTHKNDPKYHFGSYWKKVVIKPEKAIVISENNIYPDDDEYIYIPRYIPNTDYGEWYGWMRDPDGYGEGIGKCAKCVDPRYKGHGINIAWAEPDDSDYDRIKGDVVFPAVGNTNGVFGRKETHGAEVYAKNCMRSVIRPQFGVNYDLIPEIMTNNFDLRKCPNIIKFSWPKEDINKLRHYFELDLINPARFYIYSIDTDWVRYFVPYDDGTQWSHKAIDYVTSVNTNLYKNNTYIEYEVLTYYGYEWSEDLSKFINYRDFIYKNQSKYNEGKTDYYGLLSGGVTQTVYSSEFSWSEALTKTTLNCRIKDFDSNNKYSIILESSVHSNAALVNDSVRDLAKSLGKFVINKHDDVTNIIKDNTTNSVEVDSNGYFQLNYISKINYVGRDVTNNVVRYNVTSPITTNIVKSILKNREIGSFALLDLYLTSSPYNISTSRRDIITSYLELTGDFLHIDRLGIPKMLALLPTFKDVVIHYTGNDLIERDKEAHIIPVLDEISVDGYIVLLPVTFDIISSSEDTLFIETSSYYQDRTFKPDRDLTLLSSEEEILELNGPVYIVDDIEFYESAKAVTNKYMFDTLNHDDIYTYRFNIESDIDSIISAESNIKTMAESIGELTKDRQSEFIALLRTIDEDAQVEGNEHGYLITVTYISEIRYTSNSEYSGEFTSNNIVFSVVGPNVFNDNAIYVSADNRYYGTVTVLHTTYQTQLDPEIEYFVNVEHNLSDALSYVSEIHGRESNWIVDRDEYFKGLINNYTEYISNIDKQGLATVEVDYISKLDFVGYGGLFNDPINKIYENSFDVGNAFKSISYAGEISSDAAYTKDFYHYHIEFIESTSELIIPEYKIGDKLTINYATKEALLSNFLSVINTIHTMVIEDAGGELEIDRNDKLIDFITEYVNGIQPADESKLDEAILKLTTITKITCRKKSYSPDSAYVETILYEQNTYDLYITSIDIVPTNAEPVEIPLTRQLYIEDESNEAYTGVKVTKNNPSASESFYPYYYNSDSTTTYKSDVHYYEIAGNYFIENFILTMAQLNSICRDIFDNLQYLDSYNLDSTYHALPYTEACDKVCIVGINHTPGKINDIYYTVILRRTMDRNISMVDRLETEFEND